MRIVRVVGGAALMLLVVLNMGCLVKSQTLDAMLHAADAFKRKDYASFEKYVDVEALISQAVDVTIEEIRAHAGPFGSLIGGASGRVKPKVVSLTRNQFKQVFQTGLVQSQISGLDSLPSSDLLFKLVQLMGVPEDSDAYQIVDVKKLNDGERLKVNLNLRNAAHPDWLPLDVESKTAGDHVRITTIHNLKDIFRRVLKQTLHLP